MGLDFSHGNAHWAYSGFMRFRERLVSEAVGRTVDLHALYDSGEYIKLLEKDDILPLINHSDCDGHLTKTEMKRVLPRLKELIKKWDKEDYDKQQALKLIAGMKRCLLTGKKLEFR